MAEPCICVECRVRHAVQNIKPGDPPRFMTGEETSDAINALGEVMSELLAHTNTKTAKVAVADILEARKRWLKHPRVAMQHTEGNA